MNCMIVVYFDFTFRRQGTPFQIYCVNHKPENDVFLRNEFDGPSESYWIVPGTYVEDEA